MSAHGSSVYDGFNWDEGFQMPVANAENKALEDEIARLMQLNTHDGNELETTSDRVKAIGDHLKNVRNELLHTQGLVTARRNEIDTEQHMQKVAEREEGRLRYEIKRLQKEMEEENNRKNIFENSIFRQTEELEELKSQMNWDQQALEAWLDESARKDEDAMTIVKYTRQDDGKIKELNLRIQRLTEERQQKRKQLDHEMTETLTAQVELDKTAEEFRKAHSERQELIKQWESTIEQMQRRDRDMDVQAALLARQKVEVRNREEMIAEKQQFLDKEMENNRELEKKISLAERNAAKLRLDWKEAELQRTQFQDELDALKRTVERTALDLETARGEVGGLKKDIDEMMKKRQNAQELREQLQDRLKVVTEAKLSASEHAEQMDRFLQEEENKQKEIDTELRRLRDQQFKKSQEKFEAERSERNVDAQIVGSRAAIRNLNSKIAQMDHDSLKQQEILYSQDFQIQQLERRINRMQGDHSNADKLELEGKIKELQSGLDEKQQTRDLVNQQLKKLSDDIRRVKRDMEKSDGVAREMTSKIEELELYNDTSAKDLKKLISSKQDLMVDYNMLKLEIKRLRDRLNERADDVMTLEKRQLQLQTAMSERQHEVLVHRDLLETQVRSAAQELQQISAELHERIAKVDKLRKRYEILMVSMAPPEGEEEKSQAYYVIKAAQDKEELQRTGDDLDAKIRKAEKEIRALENTLKLMNTRNETYRKSFNKVTDTSEEMEEKQQLEEQLRAVTDKYKYKRRQIRELQQDLQGMSETLSTLARDEQAYTELIEEKQNKLLQLKREADEQRAKMDRAHKQNVKYARELRTARKVKGGLPEENDMDVRDARDFNRNLLKQVGEVVYQYPDVSQPINLYFTQANLPPPPAPGAVGFGSRPSSARSSLSGRSAASTARTTSRASQQSTGRGAAKIDLGADFGGGSPGSSRSSSVRSGASRH